MADLAVEQQFFYGFLQKLKISSCEMPADIVL